MFENLIFIKNYFVQLLVVKIIFARKIKFELVSKENNHIPTLTPHPPFFAN